MKKMVALISFFLIFICFPTDYVAALAIEQKNITGAVQNGTCIENGAVLIGDDGTTYDVDVYVNNISTRAFKYGQQKIEITVDLSPENIQLRSAGSKYESGWDSSGGVQAYLTIYYDRGRNASVLLQRISGGLINKDAYGTALRNCVVYASCSGVKVGAGTANQWRQFGVGSPFNIYTGFGTYVLPSNITFVGATLQATLYRVQSGSTWILTLGNSLY